MKTFKETVTEMPTILESFFFVHISEDMVGKSRPSKILPLIEIIANQNGLNLRIGRQSKIANNILDRSVIRN